MHEITGKDLTIGDVVVCYFHKSDVELAVVKKITDKKIRIISLKYISIAKINKPYTYLVNNCYKINENELSSDNLSRVQHIRKNFL